MMEVFVNVTQNTFIYQKECNNYDIFTGYVKQFLMHEWPLVVT